MYTLAQSLRDEGARLATERHNKELPVFAKQMRDEGRNEGRAEGRNEGARFEAEKIARNLLEIGLDIDQIVSVTGLSKSNIEKLSAATTTH